MQHAQAQIDRLNDPLALQQLAVAYKKQGNVEAALQALRKSKRIKAQQQGAAARPAQPALPAAPRAHVAAAKPDDTAPPKSSAPPTEPPAATIHSEAPVPPKEKENQQDHDLQKVPAEENLQKVPAEENSDENIPDEMQDVVPDENDVDLEALVDVNDDDLEDLMKEVSYSMEEMADHEMMTEFRLGDMPVPSDEDYQAKILECKRSALAAKKAGNTAVALRHLQQSKDLEKVRVALSQMNEGLGLRINADEDGWMETLTEEESELLGAMLTTKQSMDQNSSSGKKKDLMENVLEELADFMDDPMLLMDAMAMGMQVPSLEDVQAEAEVQRRLALEHKQSGDLEGAKAALRQSKQLAVHAQKLESVFQQIEQQKRKGGNLDEGEGTDENNTSESLEDLLKVGEKSAPSPKITKKALPKKATPVAKSSEELKQEAIRLRDEKKTAEAATVLKLYKAALQREKEEAELQRGQQIVNELQQEMDHARQQLRLFELYQRFVGGRSRQVSMWNEYITNCSNASNLVQTRGPDAVHIGRRQAALLHVKNLGQPGGNDFNTAVTSLVEHGSNSDPTDERLEVTILDLQNVGENTNLQRFLKTQKSEVLPTEAQSSKPMNYTVRVEVSVQLPPSEHETDKSIELVFEPTSDGADVQSTPALEGGDEELPSNYTFESSQYVNLVRGTGAHAKLIRRRIERNRKIQISVYYVAVPPKKKGGFWSSRSKNEEPLPPPTLLGKIVLGLCDLLTRNCIAAGEFPLMNGSGSKALGGTLRLGVRTGRSFKSPPSTERKDSAADVPDDGSKGTELAPYNAMEFSLNTTTAA